LGILISELLQIAQQEDLQQQKYTLQQDLKNAEKNNQVSFHNMH